MEVRLNFVQLQSQFEETKRKLKKRHPSFFDEYKYYQKEMYPNQEKSEEEYWDDFAFMAFKIELRKGIIYSFLTSEQVEEVVSYWTFNE